LCVRPAKNDLLMNTPSDVAFRREAVPGFPRNGQLSRTDVELHGQRRSVSADPARACLGRRPAWGTTHSVGVAAGLALDWARLSEGSSDFRASYAGQMLPSGPVMDQWYCSCSGVQLGSGR
jgi:hypothetical protein